jgi:hypothetical protein
MGAKIHDQVLLDVATGASGTQGPYPIATATFQSKAINLEEFRRLSVTVNFGGSHTGIFQVQGTDELGSAYGTPNNMGAGPQPGQNAQTGALYWNVIPSGTALVTNATQSMLLSFTDVGPSWIRFIYNQNTSAVPSAAVGSGTISLFFTGKNQ